MKRVISLLLVSILMLSTTIAYAADYSSMTDTELKSQFEAIRNELVIRGLKAEKKTVIFEQAGVQIYISGDTKIDKEYSWASTYKLFIPIVVVNNSKYTINVAFDNASLNGWTTGVSDTAGVIPAGKKAKGEIEFDLEDTDIESIKDFEDAEFTITIYNDDDWFGKKVVDKTEPITIYASDEE